jgi:hypothetical protein
MNLGGMAGSIIQHSGSTLFLYKFLKYLLCANHELGWYGGFILQNSGSQTML